LRVGVSAHLTLCTPLPITTSIDDARLLKTTTSISWRVSVTRTWMVSGFREIFRKIRSRLGPAYPSTPDAATVAGKACKTHWGRHFSTGLTL
jgi:hypothetical protein